MGRVETSTLKRRWEDIAALGAKVFRLNSGKAWAGKGERLPDGAVLIRQPQFILAGLGGPENEAIEGPPDLFGWTSIVVTPEMVGMTLAVTTGFEIKREDGKGTTSKGQKTFHAALARDGGIVGVVRTAEDVGKILAPWSVAIALRRKTSR
jgi:hypothetical protein